MQTLERRMIIQSVVRGNEVTITVHCGECGAVRATYERDYEESGSMVAFAVAARHMVLDDHAEAHCGY